MTSDSLKKDLHDVVCNIRINKGGNIKISEVL